MSEPPRVRDRHSRPPRFPWLVRVIIVVAVAIVVAGIVIGTALGIRWF